MRIFHYLIILLLAALSTPALAQDPSREISLTVPTKGADGKDVLLQARICRPASDAPARLVLINHGAPPEIANVPNVKLGRCGSEVSQWFLSRGYVVAYVLRRGFGASGGQLMETTRPCTTQNYARVGLESAKDIAATVAALSALPYVRQDGIIVGGVSAGGYATDAYDSMPHPKVMAMFSMAGGRGGHDGNQPNSNCRADNMAEAVGNFGKTATTPMLWVYAANDSFFSPAIANDMFDKFTAAGGKAEIVHTAAFGKEGHTMFGAPHGAEIWGPLLEAYLTKMGATAH